MSGVSDQHAFTSVSQLKAACSSAYDAIKTLQDIRDDASPAVIQTAVVTLILFCARANSETLNSPLLRISLAPDFTWDTINFIPTMIKIKDANLPELVVREEHIVLLAPQINNNLFYSAQSGNFLLSDLSLMLAAFIRAPVSNLEERGNALTNISTSLLHMVAKERDVAKEDITDFLIGISAAELVPEVSALLPMFVAPKSAVKIVTVIEQLKSPSARLTMFRSRAPIIVARSGILSKHFAAGTSSARQIEKASATINQDNKSAPTRYAETPVSLRLHTALSSGSAVSAIVAALFASVSMVSLMCVRANTDLFRALQFVLEFVPWQRIKVGRRDVALWTVAKYGCVSWTSTPAASSSFVTSEDDVDSDGDVSLPSIFILM
ncbi:hypothetical protein T492DRAFT_898133 [Pavlovales sp. CCMP2436]|nr:hypothetical protein T492DRAFT_898133 [Pavlovales sp. CCMP2436]